MPNSYMGVDVSTMDKIRTGDSLSVDVNGVSGECKLHCVERTTNPVTLKFTMFYYGVATGKEFVASNAFNKWEFKNRE